jgi:hypothetical protein
MNDQYLYNREWKLNANWEALRGLMILMFFDFLGLVFFTRKIIFYSIDETLLPLLFFLFMGLVILNIILWNLNGKEIIQVTNEKIVLRKTGKLFSSISIIDRYELESIHFENIDNLPGKLYKLNGGKIIFKYLGMEKRIGQNLTSREATVVVNDLNNLISTLPNVDSEEEI